MRVCQTVDPFFRTATFYRAHARERPLYYFMKKYCEIPYQTIDNVLRFFYNMYQRKVYFC